MTAEEVGVYIRLLCHQWNKGGLPNDPDRLAMMAGAIAQASIGYALAKFRLCEDGLLRNDRMESERQKQAEFRTEQAEKGRKGALARWKNGSGHASAIAAAMPVPLPEQWPNDGSPSPSPSPISNKEETPIAPKGASDEAKAKSREIEEQANAIYEAYPRKTAKPAALKAIRKALAKHPFDFLLSCANRYTIARAGQDPTYTPYPATWFNREQFKDDPATWGTLAAQPGATNFENF